MSKLFHPHASSSFRGVIREQYLYMSIDLISTNLSLPYNLCSFLFNSRYLYWRDLYFQKDTTNFTCSAFYCPCLQLKTRPIIVTYVFGRNGEIRTPDHSIPNAVRYQLRYIPIQTLKELFHSVLLMFIFDLSLFNALIGNLIM